MHLLGTIFNPRFGAVEEFSIGRTVNMGLTQNIQWPCWWLVVARRCVFNSFRTTVEVYGTEE